MPYQLKGLTRKCLHVEALGGQCVPFSYDVRKSLGDPFNQRNYGSCDVHVAIWNLREPLMDKRTNAWIVDGDALFYFTQTQLFRYRIEHLREWI